MQMSAGGDLPVNESSDDEQRRKRRKRTHCISHSGGGGGLVRGAPRGEGGWEMEGNHPRGEIEMEDKVVSRMKGEGSAGGVGGRVE